MQSLETKSSRPRPKSFETETKTLKNGSRDAYRDRDQVSRLHHWLPHMFAVMNCFVFPVSAVFCYGLLTRCARKFMYITVTLCTTTSKDSPCRIIYVLCHQTWQKRWFAYVNMTSFC